MWIGDFGPRYELAALSCPILKFCSTRKLTAENWQSLQVVLASLNIKEAFFCSSNEHFKRRRVIRDGFHSQKLFQGSNGGLDKPAELVKVFGRPQPLQTSARLQGCDCMARGSPMPSVTFTQSQVHVEDCQELLHKELKARCNEKPMRGSTCKSRPCTCGPRGCALSVHQCIRQVATSTLKRLQHSRLLTQRIRQVVDSSLDQGILH